MPFVVGRHCPNGFTVASWKGKAYVHRASRRFIAVIRRRSSAGLGTHHTVAV